MRFVAGSALLLAAVLFAYIALQGVGSRVARFFEELISVLALLFGVALLIDPYGWFAFGDRATSAQQRYETALAAIGTEYPLVLNEAVSEVLRIELLAPTPFGEPRRPDESDAVYEDRAHAAFERYVSEVGSATTGTVVEGAGYVRYEKDLSHDPQVATWIDTAYRLVAESHQWFSDDAGFTEGLGALSRVGGMTDSERAARVETLWLDTTLQARIALVLSMSEAVLVPGLDTDARIVEQAFRLGVVLPSDDPGSWRHRLLDEAADLERRRMDVLAGKDVWAGSVGDAEAD